MDDYEYRWKDEARPMSFTQKAEFVVERAKTISSAVKSWADFSTEIFGHQDGLIAKTFPEDAERQLFYDTEQYKTVCTMRQTLMKKFGVNKGGIPQKSGRVQRQVAQPIACACCGYVAPIWRTSKVCEICAGVAALQSEIDPAFCWIANHIVETIKHGGAK